MSTATPRLDCDATWGSCCAPGEGLAPGASRAPLPWLRLAIGLFVAAQTMLLGLAINLAPPEAPGTRLALQGGMLGATLVVLVLLGWPMLRDALRAAAARRVTMEMLFLVCLGGAMAMSLRSMLRGVGPVYFDVVAVLLIVYSVGRAIAGHSRSRAARAMGELTDALATARLLDRVDALDDRAVPVQEIEPGDLVRVLPGEFIPVDGVIVRGRSLVREATFTGEWLAPLRGEGDRVLAGALCEDGAVVVRAESRGTHRRIDDLAQLIAQSTRRPSALQRQADRFVKWFLPVVLAVAAGTFAWWSHAESVDAGIFNALAVLLVACPCAAGLATPLAMWRLVAHLASRGLLLRGGDVVEALASADSVVFDKTGTLGDERLAVVGFDVVDGAWPRERVLAVVAAVERHSTHPVAAALREFTAGAATERVRVSQARTLPGLGVEAVIHVLDDDAQPCTVRIVRDEASDGAGLLRLLVEVDGRTVARASLSERLREHAAVAIDHARRVGLAVRVMTGDGEAGAAKAAQLAPTDSRLTPEGKLEALRALREHHASFRRPIFVGDGVNDAAAMGAAHAGVAMVSGAAVAIEAAGATLHGGRIDLVVDAVELARRAQRVVRSNLAFAVSYNLVGIALAVVGWLHPITASLLMAASSALVSWRSFHLTDRVVGEVSGRGSRVSGPAVAAPPPRGEVGRGAVRSHGVLNNPFSDPVATPGVTATATRFDRPGGPPPGLPLWGRSLGLSVRERVVAALHAVGLAGQGAVLAVIVGARWPMVLLVAALFACALLPVLRSWRRWPDWADMTLAMVTLGGLGMNVGWWADLGFASVTGEAVCLCSSILSGQVAPLTSWMNLGMLALGVPAMYFAKRQPHVWRWRRWCCTGMLVLGVPGMVLGMMAGSVLAHAAFAGAPTATMVFIDYAAMMVGMVLGMLGPHALGYALPRRWGVEVG